MTNQEKLNKIARDTLILSRNLLLVNLRFLDMALSKLGYLPYSEDECDETISVDGKNIYFNARYLLTQYRESKEVVTRGYLHMVLHCVYRHNFLNIFSVDRELWDIACDIAVEASISELNISITDDAGNKERRALLKKIKKEVKSLTAEKLYHWLIDSRLSENIKQEYRNAFTYDNHSHWYDYTLKLPSAGGSGKGYNPNNKTFRINPDNTNEESISREQFLNLMANADNEWKAVAERMETDIEMFSKGRGIMPGGLIQNLKAVNREKYDYSSFLRKFAVSGEALKVNDDEFDQNFYTYGLNLYDNMPLIEPLEYKDVKRIRDFVIAIDTSGSVQGQLVQNFITKTYNILKQEESFFKKFNIHIIQCDSFIQVDAKITYQEEFDDYIKNMELKGFGGTDFRPVFGYVQYLQEQKEFTNLKGLIYLTDGCGIYPTKKPYYNVAFVFIDDDYNDYDVPSWATKLILQKEDL